ncbi:hypothetical protein [Rhodohalobacter sp. 8-1]|uniref:hypothetical protein n=1 Tax=Rhodohalobacter sp. 8-1 TaxID=3131972 RepID=UPI0030EC2FD5
MILSLRIRKIIILIGILSAVWALPTQAQYSYRWMDVGSLHNFYSNGGTEIEQGFIDEQQSGLRWPAIYQSQDAQAAKGLWIGARNVTDANGNSFPFRVAHLGPRVNGQSVFFPIEDVMYSKYDETFVFVDDLQSVQNFVEIDEVDPSLPSDRMYYTKSNTLLGITVERTIMQFSQEFHDNYHVIEFVFTNTGNVNGDDEIELPNQTLEDVVFYFQNRWAPVRATRFVMGNATGWGINTMVDRRGDGLRPEEEEDFRAHYAWHGFYPDRLVEYDNIGGPIWEPNTARGYLTEADTTGRLAAYHFLGRVTLHADTSPTDATDDPGQPSTMDEIHSDDNLNFQNDSFNNVVMQQEYERMTVGRTARHAFKVESSGLPGFIEPSGDPSLGTSGGFSAANGYGPYTLAPGESVRIVVAEAVSGISRELANETGVLFKDGEITAAEKNQIVFQGRDSLFQTFDRAIANFENGFSAPAPPPPPATFNVNSGGDGIFLDWTYPSGEDANISGFEIYRAQSQVDSTYTLVHEAGPSERTFADTDETPEPAGPPIRGRNYYYYITAVGNANNNDGSALTPEKPLRSSRYYTQTFDPASLQRPPGEALSEIRIVPNPYVSTSAAELRYDIQNLERVQFFEVPGKAKIRIYTELGELIRTIEHLDGSGDEEWDLRNDSRQRIVSGIYIVVFEDLETGETTTRKMAVIF